MNIRARTLKQKKNSPCSLEQKTTGEDISSPKSNGVEKKWKQNKQR